MDIPPYTLGVEPPLVDCFGREMARLILKKRQQALVQFRQFGFNKLFQTAAPIARISLRFPDKLFDASQLRLNGGCYWAGNQDGRRLIQERKVIQQPIPPLRPQHRLAFGRQAALFKGQQAAGQVTAVYGRNVTRSQVVQGAGIQPVNKVTPVAFKFVKGIKGVGQAERKI